jgi:tRNA threonylcarbamoyladenosine biosynthesis protein TsaE
MVYTSHSLEETRQLAEKFIAFLSEQKHPTPPNNHAAIFGFSGDLGSGKTTFTQCVAELLGITERVTSPTFVIQKKYAIDTNQLQINNFPFKTLIHIDAYRLESGAELEALRFNQELEDPTNLILIEWPEKVTSALPKNLPILKFSFVDEYVRTVEFPDMMSV